MQTPDLQRGGAAQPSQLTNHRHPSAAGTVCLRVFHGVPQESPWLRHSQAWRAAGTAWQHQRCWPSPAGTLNTACTTAACPGEKHLTLKNSHTPPKQPPSCLAAAGCFEAFLEKTPSFQPTLGGCSPACPGTALTSACSLQGPTDPSLQGRNGSASSEGTRHAHGDPR